MQAQNEKTNKYESLIIIWIYNISMIIGIPICYLFN